jgi:malate dehydrogenase (oxaloacetate-decarboxylating)(NADP+)
VHDTPNPAQLADIAVEAAAKARLLGIEPRVAMLSYSNFGNPLDAGGERIRDAVARLDARGVDFEYDGEMSADVALDAGLMRRLYPFCRLSGAANILIMPELHSANISAKLLAHLGGGTVIGPLLMGLAHPVQIVNIGATVSDLVNLAALAAHDAIR